MYEDQSEKNLHVDIGLKDHSHSCVTQFCTLGSVLFSSVHFYLAKI